MRMSVSNVKSFINAVILNDVYNAGNEDLIAVLLRQGTRGMFLS